MDKRHLLKALRDLSMPTSFDEIDRKNFRSIISFGEFSKIIQDYKAKKK
jgi:hypothetical protein